MHRYRRGFRINSKISNESGKSTGLKKPTVFLDPRSWLVVVLSIILKFLLHLI
jgi:hypothetical protein